MRDVNRDDSRILAIGNIITGDVHVHAQISIVET